MFVKVFSGRLRKVHFMYGVYADTCCIGCMCRFAQLQTRKNRRSFGAAGFKMFAGRISSGGADRRKEVMHLGLKVRAFL